MMLLAHYFWLRVLILLVEQLGQFMTSTHRQSRDHWARGYSIVHDTCSFAETIFLVSNMFALHILLEYNQQNSYYTAMH